MEPAKQPFRSEALKLAWCVVGVVGTLVVYGILQERIMKHPYGEEKKYFKHSLFIVLCNRVLTCLTAAVVLLVQRKSMAPVAPLQAYAAVSLSNVIATFCQYEALKYVSFPLQTLAKSAKMIPVMLWGTAIMQKKYGLKDYTIAFFVTAGCAIFVLAGNKKHKEVESTFWGILLMLGYLGFDGFTSTFQDKLFKGYNMETFNQILYVTFCSIGFTLFGLRQSLLAAIKFVTDYPSCLMHILVLSAAATISQFFISYTIRTFGALIFAIIMTTRQLMSICVSSLVFGPPMSPGQYGGTGLVFASLYYKSYTGGHEKKGNTPKESSEMVEEGKEVDPLLAAQREQELDQNPNGKSTSVESQTKVSLRT